VPQQAQAAKRYGNACEATVFNRDALKDKNWSFVWQNVADVAEDIGPANLTVHFPVNNSDYVSDRFVAERLAEAVLRVDDLGLHGLVVHSNRIKPIKEWCTLSLADERARVLDSLERLNADRRSPVPVFLENMPIMDNYGIEIDPLFIFPEDFKDVSEIGVGVVWDICHYSNTVAVVQELASGNQNPEHYPNVQECDYCDFTSISAFIRHWHFSAFSGLADPDVFGTKCTEGVTPQYSALGETVYADMLRAAMQVKHVDDHIVLELQETDYTDRQNFLSAKSWIHRVLNQPEQTAKQCV